MKALLVLLVGWIADLVMGDPERLPHPIVWFGKAIAWFERLLNKGRGRRVKGIITALLLIGFVYAAMFFLLRWIDGVDKYAGMAVKAILVFYCLASAGRFRGRVKELMDIYAHHLCG